MNAPDILIVAIDEDVGEMYALQLTARLRASTTWVRDCETARRTMIGGRRYDVVVLDVSFAGEWNDCLSLPSECPGTPMIVVTGWVTHDARFRHRAFGAGCAAVMIKPCTDEMLIEAVQRVRRGERRVEVVLGGNGSKS